MAKNKWLSKLLQLTAKIEEGDDASFFEKMDPDMLSIAAHIANDCLLTKTGHICKVVQIAYTGTSEVNKENGIKAEVQKAIQSAFEENPEMACYFYLYRDHNDEFKKINSTGQQSITKEIFDITFGTKSKIQKHSMLFSIFFFIPCLKVDITAYLSKFLLKKKYFSEVEQKMESLNNTLRNFNQKIAQYNPKILSIYSKNNKYYSEIVSLLYYILNFEHQECQLQMNDIGDIITANKTYSFSNRAIGIHDEITKKNKFVSVLSLKSIEKISINTIREIIFSRDILVREFCTSITNQNARKYYTDFIKSLSILDKQNETYRQLTSSDFSKNRDHMLYSTCLIIARDSIEDLEEEVKKTALLISKQGLMFAKEDFKLPSQYLSSLPGNFNFIDRISITHKSDIPSFVFSKAYDFTQQINNIFALTPSMQDGPCVINIESDKKHFIIQSSITPNHEHHKLIGFLCANFERNYNSEITIIDNKFELSNYINLTGGKTYRINNQLENTNFETNILRHFKNEDEMDSKILLKILLALTDNMNPDANKISEYNDFVKVVLKTKTINSVLTDFIVHSDQNTTISKKELYTICKDSPLSVLFESKKDCFLANESRLIHFNNDIHKNIQLIIMLYVFAACINKHKTGKTNRHQVIVLNDCFEALSSSLMRDIIPDIINMCNQNNISVIYCGKMSSGTNVGIINSISTTVSGIFIIPDKSISYQTSEAFVIPKQDIDLIRMTEQNAGHVFYKKNTDYSIIKIPFEKTHYALFSNNIIVKKEILRLKQMQHISISQPEFLDKLMHIIKEKVHT